jgi:hypothetical protein
MYALKPNDLFLKKKSISILFIYLLVSFETSKYKIKTTDD